MSLFNNFPWTNFHELNLDWLVKKVANLEASFPEGTIGIPKGGTGADNAADARANLGVYATEIAMSSVDNQVISEVLETLAGQIDTLDSKVQYKICKSVQDIGLIPGNPTISSVWTAMSAGEMLICPPDELTANECPESYGTLLMIRSGGNSGCCLFFGADHQYRKNYVSNYPTGDWEQIYTNNDIIPITNGGTGADNASDAIHNLGIDFSGTVLSVAGVGALPNGDVPLKISDLAPVDITTLGLPVGSSISAVRSAMPSNSVISAPASQFSNPPISEPGIIIIAKQGTNDELGFIQYISQSGKIFDMPLTSAGLPSGTWNPHNKSLALQYTAWYSALLWRTDSTDLYVYLPAGTLYEGSIYNTTDQYHGYTFTPTGSTTGIPISDIGLPHTISRSGAEMLTLQYTKPQSVASTAYGICSPRTNINITTSI